MATREKPRVNSSNTNGSAPGKEPHMTKEHLDVVGYWTELKLQIIQDYANVYAQVLNNQPFIKHVAYIDGFAGAGAHISKESGEVADQDTRRSAASTVNTMSPSTNATFVVALRKSQEMAKQVGLCEYSILTLYFNH
jgi:three-Cys-motif partner protein